MEISEMKTQLIEGTFPGMIPLVAAAELLNVTKAGLLKKIKSGETGLQLISLKLESSQQRVRGVTPESLAAVLREEASQVLDIEKLALARLRELAAARETEEYAPFMQRVGLTWRNPHHRNFIGKVLGGLSRRICEERRAAGDSLIAVSVLVVLKATGMPNDSFFWFVENELEIPMARGVSQAVAFARLKQAVFKSAGTW